MRTVATVRGGEEDGRVDENARHLRDVDAPRVVVRYDIGLSVTVVSLAIAERIASLLDDLNLKCAVVLDVSAGSVEILRELQVRPVV